MDEEKKYDIVEHAQKTFGNSGNKPPIKPPVGIEKFREGGTSKLPIMPLLKLIQAMSDDFSKDGITPGHFRNSITGEDLGTKVEIIPIGVVRWRRLFENRQAICRSQDGLTGVGEPGGDCHLCPLSKHMISMPDGTFKELPFGGYRFKKGESFVGSECKEIYVFPSLILTGKYPIPAAAQFRSTARKQGDRLLYLLENVEGAVFTIKSEQMSNEKGTWFTPKVELSRNMDEGEIERVNKLRETYEIQEVIIDEPEPDNGETEGD